MKPPDKAKPVNEVPEAKLVKRYFSVRLDAELIDKCKDIAIAETSKQGYPVHVISVMRKFIKQGVDAWERARTQGGSRG